jgi:hypothetical protein
MNFGVNFGVNVGAIRHLTAPQGRGVPRLEAAAHRSRATHRIGTPIGIDTVEDHN